MAYNPKDFYFKKAKSENFAARSVFKLEEIDKKFKLLRSGDHVLDLGCAPGSWSQFASKRVGPKGLVLGIDLAKVHLSLTNAQFLQGDAFNPETLTAFMDEHTITEFDVVLSDMAPKTTGVRLQDQERSLELCRRALDVARSFLKTGGHFAVKIFQSGDSPEFIKEMKTVFSRCEILRPKSVRAQSFEIYVIGVGKK